MEGANEGIICLAAPLSSSGFCGLIFPGRLARVPASVEGRYNHSQRRVKGAVAMRVECPACGQRIEMTGRQVYCPNCGQLVEAAFETPLPPRQAPAREEFEKLEEVAPPPTSLSSASSPTSP